ncbi:MAG TPA: cytochrome c oxidase subunit II [Wenzhouxiangella sp.]|nr:cytochrome c oxidase subunit II [Wenzhouxiangella sp.]
MNSQDAARFQDMGILPTQASSGAAQVDLLALAMLIFCALVLLAVFGLVLWFSWRYRAGSSVKRKPLSSERKQTAMEMIWAGGLFIVFMGFFYWGVDVYVQMYQQPDEDLTIEVVGKQWMWKLEHPNGAREIDTLHVPVNRKVRLNINSQDVIHSFYVPAFRIKKDAVPGMTTSIWFEPTEIGTYHLFCAEYCGTNHSHMRGQVIVMSQQDYSDWLTANGHEQTAALDGAQLFRTYGCSGCHIGSSVVDAPVLAGIYGRVVPLADGTTIIADEAYIRDSILHPHKDIVAGYKPVMPSFEGRMSEADLQKIIAYIRSLEPGDWQLERHGGNP